MGVAGDRDAGISSAGAVPLTSAQMIGQPPQKARQVLLIHLHLRSL